MKLPRAGLLFASRPVVHAPSSHKIRNTCNHTLTITNRGRVEGRLKGKARACAAATLRPVLPSCRSRVASPPRRSPSPLGTRLSPLGRGDCTVPTTRDPTSAPSPATGTNTKTESAGKMGLDCTVLVHRDAASGRVRALLPPPCVAARAGGILPAIAGAPRAALPPARTDRPQSADAASPRHSPCRASTRRRAISPPHAACDTAAAAAQGTPLVASDVGGGHARHRLRFSRSEGTGEGHRRRHRRRRRREQTAEPVSAVDGELDVACGGSSDKICSGAGEGNANIRAPLKRADEVASSTVGCVQTSGLRRPRPRVGRPPPRRATATAAAVELGSAEVAKTPSAAPCIDHPRSKPGQSEGPEQEVGEAAADFRSRQPRAGFAAPEVGGSAAPTMGVSAKGVSAGAGGVTPGHPEDWTCVVDAHSLPRRVSFSFPF